MLSRIETKVYASMAGSGAGTVVGLFIVWLLGCLLWHASWAGADYQAAIASVPAPVSDLVTVVLAALGALLFGYRAPASNHAGNFSSGPMDDSSAGHDAPEPSPAVEPDDLPVLSPEGTEPASLPMPAT